MYTYLVCTFLLLGINRVVSHIALDDVRDDERFTDAEDNQSEHFFQDRCTKSYLSDCPRRQRTCKISIPDIRDKQCTTQRQRNIQMARRFYKLTTFGKKTIIRFPLRIVPFLNQTMDKIKFKTALDPVDSQWLTKFMAFHAVVKKFMKQSRKKFANTSFDSDADYIRIFDLHSMQLKYLNIPYYSNPSLYPTFTDIIHNGKYHLDEVFVQRRLAGQCPFMIKLVTKGRFGQKWCELKKLLNRKYNFDTAISSALKEKLTLEKAVTLGRLYVLYQPENNGLRTIPDYYNRNSKDGSALINMTSPITLFARTRSGVLKVVAIQIDYLNTSPVFSPNSESFMWSLAKAMVDLADANVCQARWHLSHLHMSGVVYCHMYKSHLSSLHPLHEVLRYHCEGTTPHITLGYRPLVTPNLIGDEAFAMGSAGFINITMKGLKKFHYGLLDYDQLMRSHGLNSRKIKYHPFRDDGKVIWEGLKRFASEFVNSYYKNDKSVKGDRELQSFADQVSINGVGDSYGGKANIVGFPTKFKSSKELKKFITSFIWQVAMHAAINYPIEPWSAFPPLTPTKLTHNAKLHNTEKLANAMPGRQSTFGIIRMALLLGNFRINRIFDYYDKVRGAKLGKLVRKYHYQFHGCIQKLLAARNKKRKVKKQMGFQYLEPKWLTNSIHI